MRGKGGDTIRTQTLNSGRGSVSYRFILNEAGRMADLQPYVLASTGTDSAFVAYLQVLLGRNNRRESMP